MNRLYALYLALITAASAQTTEKPSPADSQQTATHRTYNVKPGPFLREFGHDEIDLWTSPFKRRNYSGHAFKKYVIPFALITGALIASDRQTADLLPNTTDQVIWSSRVSQVGAGYSLAGAAVGIYLIGKASGNKKISETGLLAGVALAHSQLLTAGLKAITQRERPLIFQANHSGRVGFWKGGNSFPSGHTSGSFALAAVFSYEYGGQHRWVPYASYGLASVVAASRLSGQKHWVSDLFAGGTMGFMIGRYAYKNHHDPRVDGGHTKRAERYVPQFGMGPRGLTLAWII